MTVLIILGILCFCAAVISFVIAAVRLVARNGSRRSFRMPIFFLLGGIVLFLGSATLSNVRGGLLLFLIAAFSASVAMLIAGFIVRLKRKSGKRCFISSGILFAVTIALAAAVGASELFSYPGKNAASEAYEIRIETEYDFEVVDGAEPVVVETSRGCGETSSTHMVYRMVYDSCDLYYLLENCSATEADCLTAINNNSEIPENYRVYFTDFVHRIAVKYPEADLSILCENLKTLKVVELNRSDFLLKSLDFNSYGCYLRTENTIYIPEGTEYNEGEWGFQVLIHEFCHAARTYWRDTDIGKDHAQFCSGTDNSLLEESMNSVFSCSLLNYEERDIAYQVPSNYLTIMLECMDNYTISDYMNHSEQYFFSKLDEFTGYTNYAQVIWKLISLQRSDWDDDSMDIPAEEYEPIYEYLCDMYYGKYYTPDMTEAEALELASELAEKAFFDAQEDYKTEPEFFVRYMNENILNNRKT